MAVVRHRTGQVRVAVTGLGQGVVRWTAAEQALGARFSQAALQDVVLSPALAEDDLHASADYKVHLAHVLCRRILAELAGETYVRLNPAHNQRLLQTSAPSVPDQTGGLAGERVIQATPLALWRLVLDPLVLQACIPGCEAILRQSDERYEAVVQVGIGLVSARFSSTVDLKPLKIPTVTHGGLMRLTVAGSAGAMGRGRAEATLSLEPRSDGSTLLRWQALPILEGKLAQIGQRFVFAVARQLSEEFLDRLQTQATGQAPERARLPWHRRCMIWIQTVFSTLKPRRP